MTEVWRRWRLEISRLELCKTYLKRSNSSAAKSQKSRPRNREKRCSRDARDGQGVGPAQKPRTGMKKVFLVRTRERQIRERETCTKKGHYCKNGDSQKQFLGSERSK